MEHIKPLHLFDWARADFSKKDSPLADWEKQHLTECEECQGVVEAFKRQFNPQASEKKAGET